MSWFGRRWFSGSFVIKNGSESIELGGNTAWVIGVVLDEMAGSQMDGVIGEG